MPASWALRGPESLLSVVSLYHQDFNRDTAKFQFIRDSAPPELCADITIGHGLEVETTHIQPISLVAADGTRVKLVDTPGFDDSREGVTEAGVLEMIAAFLIKG